MSFPVPRVASLVLKILGTPIHRKRPNTTCCLFSRRLRQGLRPGQIPWRRAHRLTRQRTKINTQEPGPWCLHSKSCTHPRSERCPGRCPQDPRPRSPSHPGPPGLQGLGLRGLRGEASHGHGLSRWPAVLQKKPEKFATLRAKFATPPNTPAPTDSHLHPRRRFWGGEIPF